MEISLYLILAAAVGMLRGSFSLILEHPLDVIKTYWQANPNKKGFRVIVHEILNLKGIKGFYSGAVPNVIRIMLKQAYRYPLMIALPFLFAMVTQSIFINSIATGLSIALIEVWIITPLERLKVWLITFRKKTGGVSSFIQEMRGHWFNTLYKGLKITALRQMTSWITFLVVHDQLMAGVKAYNGGALNLSLFMLLAVSLIEGAINTAVVQPLDCIKTNQQKSILNALDNIAQIAKEIYALQGVRGFYVGWGVRMVQYMINSAFTVAVLESLKTGFSG